MQDEFNEADSLGECRGCPGMASVRNPTNTNGQLKYMYKGPYSS